MPHEDASDTTGVRAVPARMDSTSGRSEAVSELHVGELEQAPGAQAVTQPSIFDVPVPRRHRRVRDTSIASYADARERLKGRQADVLRWLAGFVNRFQSSPTSAELERAVSDGKWITFGLGDVGLWTREAMFRTLYVRRGLSDLQTHGLVETVEKRRCAVTGRLCHTWRVTQR